MLFRMGEEKARVYLYLVMDVWSRRIVGWRIAQRESEDVAAQLITESCVQGNVDPRGLVLHSDNGTPMRGSTMISTLQWLGVVPSPSAARTSATTIRTQRRCFGR